MNMLPRLRPREFYDLVIEVAIVRPGPDPRRHGASLSAAARQTGEDRLPLAIARARPRGRTGSGSRQDSGRAAVPGAGDAARHRGGEIHAGRSQRPAPLDGDVPQFRHDPQIPREDGRQHDRARLCAGFRRTLLPADRRLRHLWLSRKPRRELRASGLHLGLDQMPSPGRVRLRAAEFAADGVLCAGRDRARCARARRRGARARRECERVGQHAGTRQGRRARAALGLAPDRRLPRSLGDGFGESGNHEHHLIATSRTWEVKAPKALWVAGWIAVSDP